MQGFPPENSGRLGPGWAQAVLRIDAMKNILPVSLALLGALTLDATAEPVLARILETSGSIHATHAGGAVQVGATLPAGASVTTGPASTITFNAFPGSMVSLDAKTRATVVSMEVSRAANMVSREATFKLDAGLLFFAVEKVNWDATRFAVLTPDGKVTAERPESPKTATAGIVEVKDGKFRVVALAGRLAFAGPQGTNITLAHGSVASRSGGEGFQVVDLTTGQTTVYNSSGVVAETRVATTDEVASASEAFSDGTVVMEALIAKGAISQELASAARETLISVNQKLAEIGAKTIGDDRVGALPKGSDHALSALSSRATVEGFSRESAANPANVSGGVRSPAQ